MWHVDEGTLHAYLDGALDEYPAAEARRVRQHLAACAECAGTLAHERRVREEAQEILGLAAPQVEVPTFEELRAYVRAQAPLRSTVRVRLYRLSWAASVVLALGTGWLLRGGGPPEIVRSDTGLEASGLAANRARTGDATAPSVLEEQVQERSNEAGAVDEVAERARGATEPSRAAGSVAEPSAPADRDDAGAKATDDTAADLLAADRRRAAPEPAAPPAPTAGPAAVATTVAPSSAPPSADVARLDSATRDEVAQSAAAEQRLTSAIAAQASPAAGPTAGARTLGRAAAADQPTDVAAEADVVSLVVPGLEVLGVLPVGQGTTFAGMRALQRLQSGDTLELVHLPAGIDPVSLPPLPRGWNELVRPRGSGWLVMRASVSEATLVELLQRLESGR